MTVFAKHHWAAGLLEGFSDSHCHILPGVDDGSKQAEESIGLLGELEKLGVKRIYCTPHIKAARFENREQDLRRQFEEFRAGVAGVGAGVSAGVVGAGSAVELRLAAEYFVDSGFERHIKDAPLTFADGSVLVEFGFSMLGVGSLEALFNANLAGYGIVLAHPERYSFMTSKLMEQLLASGYRMQLTIPSIIGFYGVQIRERAMQFLEQGVYSYLGSDIHNQSYINAIKEAQISHKLFEQLQELKQKNNELFF